MFLPFLWAVFVISVVVELVLGFPILIWLWRTKRLSHSAFAIGGLVIGFVVAVITAGLDPEKGGGAYGAVGVVACLLSALTGSVVFDSVGGWSSDSR